LAQHFWQAILLYLKCDRQHVLSSWDALHLICLLEDLLHVAVPECRPCTMHAPVFIEPIRSCHSHAHVDRIDPVLCIAWLLFCGDQVALLPELDAEDVRRQVDVAAQGQLDTDNRIFYFIIERGEEETGLPFIFVGHADATLLSVADV